MKLFLFSLNLSLLRSEHHQPVMTISKDYQPLLYGSKFRLISFLKTRAIINASTRKLSDVEIETLALGPGFVLPSPVRETGLGVYLNKLRNFTFFASRDAPGAQYSIIKQLIPHSWRAEKQDWESDSTCVAMLKQVEEVLLRPPLNHAPPQILEAVHSLKNDRAIYVCQADKGGSTVVWQRDWYRAEALRQLSDSVTYEKVPETVNVMDHLMATLRDRLAWLVYQGYLTELEERRILQQPSSLPYFYLLPKVHKKITPSTGTYPGRPIVATFGSPIHWIDKYITELTNPLIPLIPGTVPNSASFISQLPEYLPTEGSFTWSADVCSLYPSIDRARGIDACKRFYEEMLPFLRERHKKCSILPPPDGYTFSVLLDTVLNNAYFTFQNGDAYKQLTGTAMGICISVFFANTYMFDITRHLVQSPPPNVLVMSRFIDDLIFITTGEEGIPELIEGISNDVIRYECTPPSKRSTFLDIQITLENNGISTEPFVKETANPLYIHPNSYHEKHITNNIPFAQFLRLKRLCNRVEKLQPHYNKLKRILLARGYSPRLITSAMKRASSYSGPVGRDIKNSVRLITAFNADVHKGAITRQLRLLHSRITVLTGISLPPPLLVFTRHSSLRERFNKCCKTGK